jgi:hypothetical protein
MQLIEGILSNPDDKTQVSLMVRPSEPFSLRAIAARMHAVSLRCCHNGQPQVMRWELTVDLYILLVVRSLVDDAGLGHKRRDRQLVTRP